MIYQSWEILEKKKKKERKIENFKNKRFPRFPAIFTNVLQTSSLNEIIPPRSKHYSAISQFVSPSRVLSKQKNPVT